MKYKAGDIRKLLEELAEETGTTVDHASFEDMYYKIVEKVKKPLFKENYLYKRIYDQVKDANENSEVRLNAHFIEQLVKYLSYNNYSQFLRVQADPIHSILGNCVDSWYSYVRCNSGEEYVLISPVDIFKDGKEVLMKLKGGERMFSGKLKYEGNCIYCLLESKQNKKLHLVLNVGFSKKPNVLQGVFSGISTSGEPIAGREVLIRQKEKFDALKNERISIHELIGSESEERNNIGKYFMESNGNILKARQASTFELNDLKKK
jgi:hypothetical protein